MTYTATITSKRQLTIPAELFRDFGLEEGDKLLLSMDKISHAIKIEPARLALDRLMGSVKTPRRFKNKSLDEIVELAKKEYFTS